jgi:hypothetical protein
MLLLASAGAAVHAAMARPALGTATR